MQRRLAFALALVVFLSPAPLRPEAPPVPETPGFLLGANYVPSHDWHTTLENWDAAAVDADFAALSRVGRSACASSRCGRSSSRRRTASTR